MSHLVLSTKIKKGDSLSVARDRARRFAELFGLESIRRTQLVTAVSEIARNAVEHGGGGVVNFLAGDATEMPHSQSLFIEVQDKGPGIVDLNSAILGEPRSDGTFGLGLTSARKLVDRFLVDGTPGGGVTVTMEMLLPSSAPRLTPKALTDLMQELVNSRPQSPLEELERQNREMLHTLEELRRRQLDLENADKRKNEFLAMLAHELRNPLATISMSVELMGRKKNYSLDDLGGARELIGRQANQLTRLVNDLLDVSRLTQGKVDLQKEPTELNALVRHAIEMTKASVDAKGHSLVATHTSEEVWVDGDVVRLKQALSNLLHNAARYTPQNGVISVAVRRKARSVSVEIADNGIGIADEMLPRVFDLFTQADANVNRQDTGLGIGLTVVHRLVRDHGGAVTARSEGLGRGSQFTVTLPLREPPEQAEGQLASAASPSQHRGQRVLLIDDNKDSTLAIEQLLELHGYECRCAFTGEAGVATAREWRPDMAVIDIGLPRMDGFQVAQALRAQADEDGAMLVALTGYSTDDIRARAKEAGFDRYFVKPLNVDGLLDVLIERM